MYQKGDLVLSRADITESAFGKHPEKLYAHIGDLLLVIRHRPGTHRVDVRRPGDDTTFCVDEAELIPYTRH